MNIFNFFSQVCLQRFWVTIVNGIDFLTFSSCLSLVYRKVAYFCVSILLLTTFPKLSLRVFLESQHLLQVESSSENRDALISFSICSPLIYFCCHSVAITSSTILIEGENVGCLVLFLILVGTLKLFFSIKHGIGYMFVVYSLYYIEDCFLSLQTLYAFSFSQCWFLSNNFSMSIEVIVRFLLSICLYD